MHPMYTTKCAYVEPTGDEFKPLPVCHVGLKARLEELATVSRLLGRKSNVKANFKSGPSRYSIKRLIPGASNVGLIESTCKSLPRHGTCYSLPFYRRVAPQVEIESKT